MFKFRLERLIFDVIGTKAWFFSRMKKKAPAIRPQGVWILLRTRILSLGSNFTYSKDDAVNRIFFVFIHLCHTFLYRLFDVAIDKRELERKNEEKKYSLDFQNEERITGRTALKSQTILQNSSIQRRSRLFFFESSFKTLLTYVFSFNPC